MLKQVVGRVHRVSQRHHTTVHQFVLAESIEGRLRQAMTDSAFGKRRAFSSILHAVSSE